MGGGKEWYEDRASKRLFGYECAAGLVEQRRGRAGGGRHVGRGRMRSGGVTW